MLTCSKCGSGSPPGTPFCSTCGSSLLVGGLMPAIPPPPQLGVKTSAFAITGFVLSFVCGVLGLVFSLLGLREASKSKGRVGGRGFAIAGIAISFAQIAVAIVCWFVFMRAVDMITNTIEVKGGVRSQLLRIADHARDYHRINGRFPTRDYAPTESCCSESRGRCSDRSDDPAWKAIGMYSYLSTLYRFGYRSSPHLFEAIAITDNDCDGSAVTYTMRVESDGDDVRTGPLESSGID